MSTVELDAPGGLTDAEAAARLRRDGPNTLPSQNGRGLARIALGVVRQPMFLLLLATAGVYAVIGSLGDAAALLISVVAVGALALTQEARTERVLTSLKALSSPRARVVRGARHLSIASAELVVGDRLLMAEGDRLACDARLTESHGLTVDESMLTGESAPVLKAVVSPDAEAEGLVRCGSLVVQGDGTGIVLATGARTTLGRIGGTLHSIRPRPSRAESELKRVVAVVAVFAVIACLGTGALFAVRQASWSEGLLAGLTLAMAIVPEEFAVVWAVMLALGAWRLARTGVLTRQSQAIEALGTTTVMCVDKTGTLTRNRMVLAALARPFETALTRLDDGVDAPFEALMRSAALACVADGIEPMDRALLEAHEHLPGPAMFDGVLMHRVGLAPRRPYFSQWWRARSGTHGIVSVKGAPEAVLALCHPGAPLAMEVARQVEQLARQGLRVLGVARAELGAFNPPHVDASALPRLEWCGLLGFLDPLRDDVPAAMAECRAAGMRIVMITGDAPATAAAIAEAAGLESGGLIRGAQLDAMSDAQLDAAVASTTIYARVSPDHKLRIVRALQRRGDVVAMTGDGVNDASALRAADIGVAMGRRGTDVAREAASLVLLDDSFAALVGAVRMGRRIFGNLRNAVGYLLAVHVPIVGVSLLPVLTGGPVLLLPLHVVLLELLIDPACSLVFEAEPERPDCMRRPPRAAFDRLVTGAAVLRAIAIGLLAMVAVGVVFLAARRAGLSTDATRLAVLIALVAGNLSMLQWYRHASGLRKSERGNPAFGWLLIGIATACALPLIAAPHLPQLGLPENTGLQGAGAVLAGLAAGAAWRLRLRQRRTTST